MTDSQILTIALASVPTMITVLIGILINSARLSDVSNRFGDVSNRFNDLNSRISEQDRRLADFRAHVDARFDDMRAMWQSELRRVEEILDARLKHLEER